MHDHAFANGYTVVREIGGHGVGLEFHEEPWVGYNSKRGTEMLLVPGMIFTIEPMVNMGKPDIFTDEELYTLWECENMRRYLQMGPSARFGDPFVADSKPLLRNIIETGQKVIDGKSNLSASLRFGHDSYIMPLLALLNVEGTSCGESSQTRSVLERREGFANGCKHSVYLFPQSSYGRCASPCTT